MSQVKEEGAEIMPENQVFGWSEGAKTGIYRLLPFTQNNVHEQSKTICFMPPLSTLKYMI